MNQPPLPPPTFATVPGRPAVDHVFRSLEHSLVALSSMADTKANIMITVSSIVLTLGAMQLLDTKLQSAAITLMGFTLVALLLAVLAVVPGIGYPRKPDGAADPGSAAFGLLYFGHFAHLEREAFLGDLAGVLATDETLYRALAIDVYGQGPALATRKYRILRWSYLAFVGGFLTAAAVLVVTLGAS